MMRLEPGLNWFADEMHVAVYARHHVRTQYTVEDWETIAGLDRQWEAALISLNAVSFPSTNQRVVNRCPEREASFLCRTELVGVISHQSMLHIDWTDGILCVRIVSVLQDVVGGAIHPAWAVDTHILREGIVSGETQTVGSSLVHDDLRCVVVRIRDLRGDAGQS